jgi:hypothetical protein
MKEPQAAIDPPAEWWGPEEMDEVEEIGPAPESLLILNLAVKVKHLQVPSSIISIYKNEKGWELHMVEEDFRKAYQEYSCRPFSYGPSKYELFVDVHGIKVFCLTKRDEGVW